MPPSIIVEGELYSTTGEEIPIEPDEGVIKPVTSVIGGTELPSNEGEINFPVLMQSMQRLMITKEYVVVLMDLEWIKFEKREMFGV